MMNKLKAITELKVGMSIFFGQRHRKSEDLRNSLKINYLSNFIRNSQYFEIFMLATLSVSLSHIYIYMYVCVQIGKK